MHARTLTHARLLARTLLPRPLQAPVISACLLLLSPPRHPRGLLTTTAYAGYAAGAGSSLGVGDGGGAAVGGHASSADSGGEDAYLDAVLSSKFLCFIQDPAILSKVAATFEGHSPKSREVYWAEERIQVQTISPGQRLENGIKTHMGVPST